MTDVLHCTAQKAFLAAKQISSAVTYRALTNEIYDSLDDKNNRFP